MQKIQTFIFVGFSIILSAGLANAGECCKAYTDILGVSHPEQYCSNYCCYRLLAYVCCDDELQHIAARALGQANDFCLAWFKSHVWQTVLIGIGGFALLCAIAACCRCLCRGASARGVVL